MSKTVYYRETNPKTGKQKWVKIDGVYSNGTYLFIRSRAWENVTFPGDEDIQIVYKTTRDVIK